MQLKAHVMKKQNTTLHTLVKLTKELKIQNSAKLKQILRQHSDIQTFMCFRIQHCIAIALNANLSLRKPAGSGSALLVCRWITCKIFNFYCLDTSESRTVPFNKLGSKIRFVLTFFCSTTFQTGPITSQRWLWDKNMLLLTGSGKILQRAFLTSV